MVEYQVCQENWQSYLLREKIIMPTKNEISEFSNKIIDLVESEGCTIMDAIVSVCEKTGMEIDVASTLVSSSLKSKLREEAESLNMLKKSSKLPL